MKFCIHLSTRISDKRHERPLLDRMTDMALEAEANGFAAISLTEHHLYENQGYQNSLLFACALAPQLTRATLILATVNPAIHHPVRLVESCNLIDQLNRGRLVVGFGSGFNQTDLILFGRPVEQRHELYEQGLRAALDVWAYDGTGGPLEFAVGSDRGRLDAAVNPSSFRRPRPILARATLNQSAMIDVARQGWPVLTAIKDPATAREHMIAYRAALSAAGHDAETVRVAKEWSATGKAVHVAESDAQARAEAEAFFAKNPSGAIARNPDDMICGSPTTVARAMSAFAASGVGVMICGFLIDVEDPLPLQRSLRLFREEVIPMVSAESEPAPVHETCKDAVFDQRRYPPRRQSDDSC
jgi:alkanesulfonate monooxygenase SsuD/methylene tetrahydromethanopterin reductase-like flavin-dependent oxidoreductase (luciferase family)